MARKPELTGSPVNSSHEVYAALKRNDFLKATELARALAESSPTDLNRKLYAETLGAAFQGYTSAGKVKAVVETLKIAAAFAVENPTVAEDIAILHAKAGEFPKALQLANTNSVQNHIADLCVRRSKAEGLGQDYKSALASILKAFQLYEAGNDDAAREATQAIGLTSPFLQWRVLLRGLIAYSAGDNPRAIENWQRLLPEFLPAKLAATLRVKIDPAFRAAHSSSSQADLHQKSDSLQSSDLTRNLRQIQKYTSRDQSIHAVWKYVLAVVPALKNPFPNLFERLGSILYHSIIHNGEPSDMKQYRNIFGPPKDDPEFYKLEAIIFEHTDDVDYCIKMWEKYEEWLATGPPGWPKSVLNLARANILHRIGGLLEQFEHDDSEEEQDDRSPMSVLERLFSQKAGLKPKRPAVPRADPAVYYRRSISLAPNWAAGVQGLLDRYRENEEFDKIIELSEQYLKNNPNDLAIMQELALAYSQQDRLPDHLATLKRAVAINPLDENLNSNLAQSYCLSIRQLLVTENFTDCERLMAEANEIATRLAPLNFGCLKVMVARKSGRSEEADTLEQTLIGRAGESWAATFTLVVLGLLVKLKLTQRKACEARLKELLETPIPSPRETASLAKAWSQHDIDGIDYKGKSTHEKKITGLIERSLRAAPTPDAEEQYEIQTAFLLVQKNLKSLKKVLPVLQQRYSKNPFFYLIEAQAILANPKANYRDHFRVPAMLKFALANAEASPHPRHKPVVELIAEMIKMQPPDPFELFGMPDFR